MCVRAHAGNVTTEMENMVDNFLEAHENMDIDEFAAELQGASEHSAPSHSGEDEGEESDNDVEDEDDDDDDEMADEARFNSAGEEVCVCV